MVRELLEICLTGEAMNQEEGLRLSSAWLPALDLIQSRGLAVRTHEREKITN